MRKRVVIRLAATAFGVGATSPVALAQNRLDDRGRGRHRYGWIGLLGLAGLAGLLAASAMTGL
jgi:hypothetical protein